MVFWYDDFLKSFCKANYRNGRKFCRRHLPFTAVNDKKAWSILGEVGVMPSRGTLMLGYRNGDNGAATRNKDNALLVGGTWMVAQNIELQLSHTRYSGNKYDDPEPAAGDALTTLMLFMGF